MSKPFDPGWIPPGWTRGESLLVREPRRHPEEWGFIEPERRQPFPESDQPSELVQYQGSQAQKVNAWLRWWWGSDEKPEDKRSAPTPLHDHDALGRRLQDALYEVIQQDRFKGMSVAQTVGVLEFLKWNIINQSGGD